MRWSWAGCASVRVTEETCAAIKATAQENDVSLSVHAPYFINLNADDEEWPKSRQRLMDAAHYGNLAGASDIIFHPGSYFERPADEVLPLAIERLQGCIDELRRAGNPVILRPETMGKSAMLGSLEDTLAMSQAIPGVIPCIDFAHLHARLGDGSMNTYAEWMRTPGSVCPGAGRRGAARPAHPPLGHRIRSEGREGAPAKWKKPTWMCGRSCRALHACGCRGRILCESPVLEDDALLIRQMWLEISQEV